MPISPEKQKLYPGGSINSPEWRWIRALVSVRSGNKCERCQAPNGKIILRSADMTTYFYEADPGEGIGELRDADTGDLIKVVSYNDMPPMSESAIIVVLTVAHLDQDVSNNDPENLAHLCQLHHNRLDAKHRAKSARENRLRKAGQSDLFQARPHRYSPDYEAMGDCKICGHVADAPHHRGRDD